MGNQSTSNQTKITLIKRKIDLDEKNTSNAMVQIIDRTKSRSLLIKLPDL